MPARFNKRQFTTSRNVTQEQRLSRGFFFFFFMNLRLNYFEDAKSEVELEVRKIGEEKSVPASYQYQSSEISSDYESPDRDVNELHWNFIFVTFTLRLRTFSSRMLPIVRIPF